MLTDKELTMSDSQAVTASAASTNTIDLTAQADIGPGTEVEVFLNVNEAATASGSATVDFELQTDSASSFGSPTTLFKVSGVPKASIVPGYNPFAGYKLPYGCERFIRGYYTVSTGPLTAGKFTLGLVKKVRRWVAHKDGI